MSKFCAKCGANIAENAGFCPLCGFAANAKLPPAPVKKAEQIKPAEPAAKPQKTKKNPLGIIPIIIAAVSLFITFILLILLLIPDNKCDLCGEKAKTKTEKDYNVRYCDECEDVCTLCGEKGARLGKLASGKTVFMCEKCEEYIENNAEFKTQAPSDKFNETEPSKYFANNTEDKYKPAQAQNRLPTENETTEKRDDISGGKNNVSGSSTSEESSDVTTQPKQETSAEAKTDYIPKGKLNYKGCEFKVKNFDPKNKTVTFEIVRLDPEFKDSAINIKCKNLDKNGEPIGTESTISVNFSDIPKVGDVSEKAVVPIDSDAATIQFSTEQ